MTIKLAKMLETQMLYRMMASSIHWLETCGNTCLDIRVVLNADYVEDEDDVKAALKELRSSTDMIGDLS